MKLGQGTRVRKWGKVQNWCWKRPLLGTGLSVLGMEALSLLQDEDRRDQGQGPAFPPPPPLLKLWDNKAKHFSKSCSSFGEPLRDAVHGAKSREAAGAPPWRHLELTLLSWQNSGHKEHPPPGEAGRLVSLKCLSLEDS